MFDGGISMSQKAKSKSNASDVKKLVKKLF